MSKSIIDVKLDKINKVKLSNFKKNNETEILLLEAPKEDLSLLKEIGFDFSLQEVENQKNQIDALIGLEKVYNKPVYLGEDIKKLCIEYDLRLLPVNKFKGNADSSLIKIIKDFAENSKTDVSLMGYERFFILAPEEYFFSDKPVKSLKNCTIFYREENRHKAYEDQKFIKIHSWGENYSPLRKFNFLLDCSAPERDMNYGTGFMLLVFLTIFLFVISYIFKTERFFTIISLITWILKFGIDMLNYSDGHLNYIKKWNNYEKNLR